MAENGRYSIVDVREVKMVYNAKNRDESTHVHALRACRFRSTKTSSLRSWALQARARQPYST